MDIAVIVSSVVVFLIIVYLLVIMLFIAEKKLISQDDVEISINDDPDKVFNIKPGGTLLSSLAMQNIFIPSACGGGVTCGVCKCQVDEGGGDILSTETSHISRSEAKENWRLSCQVKVRESMKIRLPNEVLDVKKWECSIKSNRSVATFIK